MPTVNDTFSNYGTSTVAGGAGGRGTTLNPTDTTLFLPVGDGTKFPSLSGSLSFRIQLGTTEIAIVTAKSTDVLTLTRGAEGTTAGTWPINTSVLLVLTAAQLGDLTTAIAASLADPTTTKGDLIAHGTTTTRLAVGSDTQVLTADSTQTLGIKWAAPSTGASTADHYVVGSGGQADSDLSSKLIIPALSGSADIRVAGANDDEFDQNSSGAPGGWTTFGANTPVYDTNTFVSHLRIGAARASGTLNGILKAAPSIPYTVTAKLSDTSMGGNFTGACLGIFDGSTTGKAIINCIIYDTAVSATNPIIFALTRYTNWTTPSSNDATFVGASRAPVYLRLHVTAASNIDAWFSFNGQAWTWYGNSTFLSNATYAGLVFIPENTSNAANNAQYSVWDWIRFS